MDLKNNEDILYIIEVHGHAPEFWPVMAFRKDSSKNKTLEEPERKKNIKCPYCGKLFMVVSVKRRLDLVRFTQRMKASCHEYRQCRQCRENIGIVYLAAEPA